MEKAAPTHCRRSYAFNYIYIAMFCHGTLDEWEKTVLLNIFFWGCMMV